MNLAFAPFHVLKLVTTITFIGLSSFAWAGGADVGGGNVRSSTPSQVEVAIIKADNSYILEHLVRHFLSPDSAFPILDTKAREILIKTNAIWQRKLFLAQPVYRGPCKSKGQDRDSSLTIVDDRMARVCFSIERLTRFPPSELVHEIFALFVHEVSHAAGYNETDAVFIQNYILEKYLRFDCHIYLETVDEKLKASNPRYYSTTISIDFSKSHLPTTHVKNYSSNQVSSAGTTIDREFSIFPNDLRLLKGNWSFETGGYIEFPTVESDGNLKIQHIEFGPAHPMPNPEFLSARLIGGSLIVDGRDLQIKEIKFLDCQR